MAEDFSKRLRDLRSAQGWTVADMAERTGIPKRTLDKYMLRSGAIMPGFDALMALSKGLGVSLDWLVFGKEFGSEITRLVALKATSKVAVSHFETLVREHENGEKPVIQNGLILGMDPERWAFDVAWRASEEVIEMARQGVTYQDLLEWEVKLGERDAELLREMASRIIHNTPANPGSK